MKTSYKIILIISLLFNLAFIGTFVYMRLTLPKPFKDNMKKQFGDKEWFGELSETHKLTMEIGRNVHEQKRFFFQKLSENTFNEDETRMVLENFISNQSEFERLLGENLITIRKKMSQEDAAKFFLHPRLMPDERPFKPLKRKFDNKKDMPEEERPRF